MNEQQTPDGVVMADLLPSNGEVPSSSIVGPVIAVLAIAIVGAAGWFWVGGTFAPEPKCDLTLNDGRHYIWPQRDDGRCYTIDAKKEHPAAVKRRDRDDFWPFVVLALACGTVIGLIAARVFGVIGTTG